MNFEELALQEFPNIGETITRAQIKAVVTKYNIPSPAHIYSPNNRHSHGVYLFGQIEAREPAVVETDEEIEQRISDRYESMEIFIEAVAANTVNSLIIAGAPGLGKSYGVNKVLHRVNGGEYGYVFHRGYIRATHLFRLLWENRLKGQTIVLDDTDSLFDDSTALNILKAALELKETRMIGWGSEKDFTDQDGETIPRYFDYEGSIIFLTNLPFSELAQGTGKHAPHLSALESRSLVLDLKIKTKREYMIKIKQTIKAGMLTEKGLTNDEADLIYNFMNTNIDKLKELSIRMCEKITALYLMDKENWVKLATTVCLK